MKIQSEVLRQTARIGLGELALCAILALMLGPTRPDVLLGLVWGGGWAVANFFLMGLSVQRAVDCQNAKRVIQTSYTFRMLATLAVAAVGLSLPGLHGAGVVLPLLFPRLTVRILQRSPARGR